MIHRQLRQRLRPRAALLPSGAQRSVASLGAVVTASPDAPRVPEDPELAAWSALVQNDADFDPIRTMRAFLTLDGEQASPQRRQELVDSPVFIRRVGAIAQWGFAAYADVSAIADEDADAEDEVAHVFRELGHYGNMARGNVWQHFYLRRFFLSQAPLRAFVGLYEVHAVTLLRPLPLPASLLLKELCWRGRFAEAVTAYAELPLRVGERRSFTALLHEYEQYALLRQVYELTEAKITTTTEGKDPQPVALDAYFILNALKQLRQRDELLETFARLPARERRRPEIQELLAGI